jgi:hypothetical protein
MRAQKKIIFRLITSMVYMRKLNVHARPKENDRNVTEIFFWRLLLNRGCFLNINLVYSRYAKASP